MKSFQFILIAIFSSLGFTAYGADTFKVDPVHSSVIFSIKHNGIADFYGSFKQITGTVMFDLVETRTGRVVWRAWVEGSLDGVVNNQEWMERKIDDVVARLFEKVPRRP